MGYVRGRAAEESVLRSEGQQRSSAAVFRQKLHRGEGKGSEKGARCSQS
jgi:hypothetical protein